MQVYLVHNASIAPPTYVNICYIYRLRYVIGCMLYTNSCKFEILQKVCVQLKISELVKLKCQQSSCPQSVSCPKEKWSPPLQRGHTQVSSLRSRLPWWRWPWKHLTPAPQTWRPTAVSPTEVPGERNTSTSTNTATVEAHSWVELIQIANSWATTTTTVNNTH